MNKKRKTLIWICFALGVILCLLLLFLLIAGSGGLDRLLFRFKSPGSYTWEEYEAMSNEAKDEFFHRFDSLEEFEGWKESVQPTVTQPQFLWENSNKQPDAYTWEEYQALSAEMKEAFYQWFTSEAAFENWMNRVQSEGTVPAVPEWDPQDKQPNEYTWEEYQALTPEQQDAFFLWFSSETDFESWMKTVKPEEDISSDTVWDPSNKKPSKYTWNEYQALLPEEKDAFFEWFGSVTAFEAWMDAVKPSESGSELPDWNKAGKDPDEYTWEEYQALSPEAQDAFFLWFDNMEAFELWADQAQEGSADSTSTE